MRGEKETREGFTRLTDSKIKACLNSGLTVFSLLCGNDARSCPDKRIIKSGSCGNPRTLLSKYYQGPCRRVKISAKKTLTIDITET